MATEGVRTAHPVLPFRVGHGFDLHRLEEGYKLIIGGLEIPHTKGCVAHSDGRANHMDAVLHACMQHSV
jgi:2-C-methyl-D-erythritol 2,4-cyclodiphosphate synthase